MAYYRIIITDKIERKILDRGITLSDVQYVVENPQIETISRSSGRPAFEGWTESGLYLFVVYEVVDEDIIQIFSAYEV